MDTKRDEDAQILERVMQRVRARARKALAILSACALGLAACGGGGSGSSGNGLTPPAQFFPDELGPTGQIAGTQTVASDVPNWDPAVTLDDAGRALVVWSDASKYSFDSTRVGEPSTYYWTRSDINGNWQQPAELTDVQSPWSFPRLRGNGEGHAVMFTFAGRWRRFDPVEGWGPEQGLPTRSLHNFGRKEPLQVDGAWPIAVIDEIAQLPMGMSAARVLTNEDTQTWNTRFTSNPASLVSDAFVAPTKDFIAPMMSAFWIERGGPTPGYRLKHTALDSNGASTPLVRTIFASDDAPCLGYVRLTAAASAERNVALWSRATNQQGCDVEAIRFDNVTHTPIVDRVNASGYIVSERPLLEMDSRGNALLIWSEEINLTPGTRRLRWSQSLNGGPWSEPQPLIANESAIGVPHAMSTTSFAMNSDGKGAISLTAVKGSRGYFVRGRFSFETGWSDWQPFAIVAETPYTDVAINSRGDAIAVYSAPPCKREPYAGGGTTFTGCTPRKVFAVRF